MKTLSFWLRKGGCGKTTCAGNVAAELARHGATLAVDLDSQGNLSSWLLPGGFDYEAADVLQGKVSVAEAARATSIAGLHVLGTYAIGGDLQAWCETQLPLKPFAFADFKQAIAEAGYRYCVLDLAAGENALERNALAISDDVCIVLAPEFFAVDGLETAREKLADVKRDLRAGFKSDLVVANRVNRSYSAHKVLLDELNGESKLHVIGQSQAIHDAIMCNQTLAQYDSSCKWLDVFQAIAGEVR